MSITEVKSKGIFKLPSVSKKNREAKVVLLQLLPLDRISLRAPLALTVEYEPGRAIVSSADLELFGYGDTESEAILDFAKSLEEFFASLKKNRKRLSRYLKVKFDFLNAIVREK